MYPDTIIIIIIIVTYHLPFSFHVMSSCAFTLLTNTIQTQTTTTTTTTPGIVYLWRKSEEAEGEWSYDHFCATKKDAYVDMVQGFVKDELPGLLARRAARLLRGGR